MKAYAHSAGHWIITENVQIHNEACLVRVRVRLRYQILENKVDADDANLSQKAPSKGNPESPKLKLKDTKVKRRESSANKHIGKDVEHCDSKLPIMISDQSKSSTLSSSSSKADDELHVAHALMRLYTA